MSNITKKIERLRDDPNDWMTWTKCFAVPGSDTIIDMARPQSGLSAIYGRTLEEVRGEYPGAELVDYDEFKNGIAARQNAEMATGTWDEVPEKTWDDMLNVLPPAAQQNGAFMVGEPTDHHAGTGRPRFTCFKWEAGKAYRFSASITLVVFRQMFGECQNNYVE
jgi:hypothetical protein